MGNNGESHEKDKREIDSPTQANFDPSIVVPIRSMLAVVVGILILIWWWSNWMVFDSMSSGMCFVVILPGGLGIVLIGYGIVSYLWGIWQNLTRDDES